MKLTGSMYVVSHLLAAVVGVAVWQVVVKKPHKHQAIQDIPSHAKSARDPAEAEVLLRLAA
jgi:hypothetical protein